MAATRATPVLVRDGFAGVGFGSALQQLEAELGIPIQEDAVEIMKAAQLTRSANGMKTVGEDVRDIEPVFGQYDGEIYAPPCTTFSACGLGAGRKFLDVVLQGARSYSHGNPMMYEELSAATGDERTALVLEPLRILIVSRPRWIMLEQVPSVLPVWDAYAEVLRPRGYQVVTGVVRAEQYGVPQARKRAILLARSDGIAPVIPAPTHSAYYSREPGRLDVGVKRWVSMAEAIGRGRTDGPSPTITGGGVATGGAEPIGNAARKGLRKSFDAGNWEGPWLTVKEGGQRLTIREAATLQSFPKDFEFQGDGEGWKYLQIGNAFPPKLGVAMLRQFFTVR